MADEDLHSEMLREEVAALRHRLSELEQAESQRLQVEQALHAQRLDSLGTLAGGIAHDFNNLLTVILGNTSLALMDLPADAPARHPLRQIEITALRAADLTRQMLAYSGKGRFVVQALNLSEQIEEMDGVLATVTSGPTKVRYELASALPAIEADAAQIRQVVLNLVANAAEAMGDQGGIITLRTGVHQADSAYLYSSYLQQTPPEGCYVYVEVADSGCGIDADTLKRVFDPFFTTKFMGRGLGLAAVLGIVRGHRGTIKVFSEPGKGTTFRALFPSVAAAPAPGDTADGTEPAKPAKGRILVIDDEEGIRSLTRTVLERAGFPVVAAADGAEALRLFHERTGEFAAVLLDLTMPNLSGEEVLSRLQQVGPRTPVLLMSGYNEQEVINRFAGKGLAGFIQKPFRPTEMLAVLRRILRLE
jgi:signal transduction histidine kinase/CheY-like chemotaxis protein